MEKYDSRMNIEEYWTYRDLLEMIYVEDLSAIRSHQQQKKITEQQELEEALKNR